MYLMKNIQKRFIELDLWRSLAVIGMIIYHIIFLSTFLGLAEFYYFRGGWWLLGHFVRFSFLLLVGISLSLSYQKTISFGLKTKEFYFKQFRRFIVVAAAAILVTLVSYLAYPEEYIAFGILHLIAVSIFILAPITSRPYTSLILSAIIFLLAALVNATSATNFFSIVLGSHAAGYKSLDLFPIFPWMALPALGIFLGHIFYKNYRRRVNVFSWLDNKPWALTLATIGKKSLLIYLVHIPILAGLIFGIQYLLKVIT